LSLLVSPPSNVGVTEKEYDIGEFADVIAIALDNVVTVHFALVSRTLGEEFTKLDNVTNWEVGVLRRGLELDEVCS